MRRDRVILKEEWHSADEVNTVASVTISIRDFKRGLLRSDSHFY